MLTVPFADRLVTPREAMHLLGIGSTTLYKFCRKGHLIPIKFSRRCTRFRLSEIQGLINGVTSTQVAP